MNKNNNKKSVKTLLKSGIKREAMELKAFGWDVKARQINGFETPPFINQIQPDIYAQMNGKIKIIKVETRMRKNDNNLNILKNYACKKKNIRFYVVILDKIGRRIRYVEGDEN